MEINKIYQGDCLELMKQIKDKSVDMILCDLPYGTTACKWDVIIPFDKLWKQYERIIKNNGAIVLTASQPFTSALVMSNPKLFKHSWIWEKQKASNFMCMKYQPAKYHEDIVVFGKKTVKFNPIKWIVDESKRDKRKTVNNPITNKDCHLGKIARTRKADDGSRYPKSIIKIDKKINSNLHPTQKPVKLFEYLIKTYSDKGCLVLDNCAGSGTTAIASINTGRNWICIESDKKYFEIAQKRIEEHSQQSTLLPLTENSKEDGIPPTNELVGILPKRL